MNKKRASIDGFVPRRSGSQVGDGRHTKKSKTHSNSNLNVNKLHFGRLNERSNLGDSDIKKERKLHYTDIGESLRSIDDHDDNSGKKPSRRQQKKINKHLKKPRSKFKKIVRFLIILIVVGLVGFGGYRLYQMVRAGSKIFQGNAFNIFNNVPLRQDSNGRSNFLILGTSEDDAGHDGADLTDSMLVVSINQNDHSVYMFSVPRDLYVKYGEACASGYQGKINAYFTCANDGDTDEDEQDRLKKTQQFVGDIFGIDIQYGVHVNHTVIKQAVDAVGGIDVDVQGSNGDSGILDRNFDWRCNYNCYLVKYENGVHHLDGEHALFLAMARGDIAPTYGLSNSNFDREKNQQKILLALKEKATSTGTLTDLNAITKLIDALGDNLRTNIKTEEIRTIVDVASKVKSDSMNTLSLFGQDESVVTTGSYGGASVVMPAAGIFDYSEIRLFIAKNLSNNPIAKESAPIVVLNGTDQAGYAKLKSDELTKEGYKISVVDNAPDGKYQAVEIYQIGTDSPGTAKKLASKYKVELKTTAPPIEIDSTIQFVIIFGSVASSDSVNN